MSETAIERPDFVANLKPIRLKSSAILPVVCGSVFSRQSARRRFKPPLSTTSLTYPSSSGRNELKINRPIVVSTISLSVRALIIA